MKKYQKTIENLLLNSQLKSSLLSKSWSAMLTHFTDVLSCELGVVHSQPLPPTQNFQSVQPVKQRHFLLQLFQPLEIEIESRRQKLIL